MCISAGTKGGKKFSNVVRAASFHRDVDSGIPEVDAVISAIVGGFNNVCAMLGENAG